MPTPWQVLVIFMLSSASADSSADEILEKQETCDALLTIAGETVLDEGGDKFLGTPRGDFFKCKNELDDMKRQYINNVLLGLQFYHEVFPIRLSNGTLLMLPVPSQSKSSDGSNDNGCAACEGLCMTSKKCAEILNNINENDDSSDSSYYKIKYSHCTALLDLLKLKYIRENNINIDLLMQVGELRVLCNEETLIMSLPQSLKGTHFSEIASPIVETTSSFGTHTNSKTLDNSVEVNTVSKTSPSGDISNQDDSQRLTTSIQTDALDINSIPSEFVSSPVEKHPDYVTSDTSIDKLYSTVKKSEDKNDDTDDKTTVPSAVVDESMDSVETDSNKKPTKAAESMNVKSKDDSDFIISDNSFGKDSTRVSYHMRTIVPTSNEKIIESVIVASHFREDDIDNNDNPKDTVLTQVPRDTDTNKDGSVINSPKNTFGDNKEVYQNIITATPMPETLGDEIFQKETDCEELLRTANEMHDYRTFESVSYYDNQYDDCVESLNKLKDQYIRRHLVDVSKYRALFPVTLSTGVEKLVLLPPKVSDPTEVSRSPCFIVSESSSHRREDEIFRGPRNQRSSGSLKESYGNSNYLNRIPLENPALISNEKFLEYFIVNPSGETVSPLSRFANMLRKNGGRTEKKLMID